MDDTDVRNESVFNSHHGSKAWNGDDPAAAGLDEFELEMEEERGNRLQKAEIDCGIRSAAISVDGPGSGAGRADYYDKDYFDSSEEEEEPEGGGTSSAGSSRRKVIPNDELFYDPDMDEADQKWVDSQRKSHHHHVGSSGERMNAVKPAPNSDAVLSCPACFAILCLDCQKHDKHHHQFRAMFVTDCCSVDSGTQLQFPLSKKELKKKQQQNFKKGRKTSPVEPSDGSDETFHPVKCSQCNTQVAVLDGDEVYHFFNVLPSHA